MTKRVDITITILTYNGEKYLKQILRQIYKQHIDKEFEVLIIDSGSTDKTLKIIRQFPQVRLHEIENSEFGHGKTRQLAAELAKGDIVVYLTHDAVPANRFWLYELVKPFEINEKIVGVMGKQAPRPHCFPLLKYEIQKVFAGFGPDYGTTLFYKDMFVNKQAIYDAVCFYSDANSAARKSYLLGQVPYRDVSYAEDQIFGRDIIEKGFYKAYAPRGIVHHSNDLRLREYKKRMFDETFALRQTGILKKTPSKKSVMLMLARGIVGDSIRIVRDPGYSKKRKVYWLILNPLYHIEKWRGVYKATRVGLRDNSTIQRHSLEANRKNTLQ